MSSEQLVREAQTRIRRLPSKDLRVAIAFLAFLETSKGEALSKRDREAVASFRRAWAQAHKRKVRPLRELRWDSKG